MSDTTAAFLVRTEGGAWAAPEVVSYAAEDQLQDVLAGAPDRIPGVPNGAVAVRELQTSAGFIDILVIAPSGAVTVAECKLARNSEKRRMVIGQILDYASSLRADGIGAFRNAWSARGGIDLDEYLDEGAVQALEENLSHGRINLCLAVDQIDDDLRRLVEYPNLITGDEIMVTALQLAYARQGAVEILVPSTFGAEIAASKSVGKARRESWTWDAFLEALADEQDRQIALDLRARLEAFPAVGNMRRYWFGNRPGGGIFFHIHSERFCAFQVWQNAAHELMVYGNWSQWRLLNHHEGFAELAHVMGQSHLDRAKSVPAKSLDIDAFWRAAVACDFAINEGPTLRQ